MIRQLVPQQLRWYLRSILSRMAPTQYRSNYGINGGDSSSIARPRQLDGAAHIRIGNRTTICQEAWLSAYDHYEGKYFAPEIMIGNDVYIGAYACITCISGIWIGDGCVFSDFVYISDHVHGFDPEGGLIAKQSLTSKGKVEIGAHTFLGYRVCVLPGVTLGKHCVVGANSVVTHPFPAYSMLAGSPARLIKRYSLETHTWIPVDDLNKD